MQLCRSHYEDGTQSEWYEVADDVANDTAALVAMASKNIDKVVVMVERKSDGARCYPIKVNDPSQAHTIPTT